MKTCLKKFPSGTRHGHYNSDTCPYCPMPNEQNNFVLELHLRPRYKHDDCENCRYLGRFEDYDLYYCEAITTKTVLARYSSEPSKYLSGWGSSMVPLMVAEALAYRKNLVSKDKI